MDDHSVSGGLLEDVKELHLANSVIVVGVKLLCDLDKLVVVVGWGHA